MNDPVKALVRQRHFWIMLATLAVGVVLASGWLSESSQHAVHFAVAVVSLFSYLWGALWSPPRRPWTAEERAKRLGETLEQAQAAIDAQQPGGHRK